METVRAALVTGGSSGIGQGIAIVLAEHGYDIAITYGKNAEGGEKTKKQIEALGRRCFLYQASLERPEVPAQIVDQAHRDLGRLDVLVNNAGRDSRNSVLTATAEDIHYIMDVNFRGYCLAAGRRRGISCGIRSPATSCSSPPPGGIGPIRRISSTAASRRPSSGPANPWRWTWRPTGSG